MRCVRSMVRSIRGDGFRFTLVSNEVAFGANCVCIIQLLLGLVFVRAVA